MKDLSLAYNYFERKFLFKIDDLTDSAQKLYIQTLKSNFKLDHSPASIV
jgi:hypothetical protein